MRRLNPSLPHPKFAGRQRGLIQGCPIFGALSRWPLDDNGAIAGPEERLLDTEIGNKACVQFSTHSAPSNVQLGPDGSYYLSFGDGAGFTMVRDGFCV